MKSAPVLIAIAVAWALPRPALAALSCPDRAPRAITTVAEASLKCQETIAKETSKVLATKLKILGKCKTKQPAGACPLAADTLKIEGAASKAATKIASKCGDDAAQAGLTSSYASETNDAIISSCVLSQHNVIAELVSAESNGVTLEPWLLSESPLTYTGKERAGCVKELNKEGIKFIAKALKTANGCLKKQMKNGAGGDLAPVCVGSFSGGAFVPPTEEKTALKQTKLLQKVQDKIDAKCAAADALDQIPTIFACPGSATIGDLQNCIVCGGYAGVIDAVDQEYSETGEFVAHGAGALQAAVNGAAPGDKLLIDSGDYVEEVTITTADLALVGCGGATNDRPRIVAPAVEVSGRGFQANGIDGLSFQSLELFNQTNDGIRVAGVNGVTFRDIVGDGNFNSRYTLFPVQSNNVVVELSTVRRVADAGIYVGQSSTVLARYNDVRESVAGTEIENCGNAQVYGNYATDNTGGLLVFKDGSLPVQLSQCHDVHHNLFESNNRANIGSGTVAGVPDGTGMLVISNDTTTFHHNIARDNKTFGYALTDDALAGLPIAADQLPQENFIYDNQLTSNGLDPDFGFGADFTVLYGGGTSGNCKLNNLTANPPLLSLDTQNAGAGLPACVLPAVFASCPAPPVTSSTTTIATTSTTTSSTTTTTLFGSPGGAFVEE